jgi:hypothetical protein
MKSTPDNLLDSILEATKQGYQIEFWQSDRQTLVLDIKSMGKRISKKFSLVMLECSVVPAEMRLDQEIKWLVEEIRGSDAK